MRRNAVAAATVLLLASCGGGSDEPEALDPGPLLVRDGVFSCLKPGNPVLTGTATIENTGDVPLTIDEVRIEGASNAELVGTTVKHGAPAVDATIPEEGPDRDQELSLEVRILDTSVPATFETMTIDYHNVEGRFRAEGAGVLLDLRTACRP